MPEPGERPSSRRSRRSARGLIVETPTSLPELLVPGSRSDAVSTAKQLKEYGETFHSCQKIRIGSPTRRRKVGKLTRRETEPSSDHHKSGHNTQGCVGLRKRERGAGSDRTSSPGSRARQACFEARALSKSASATSHKGRTASKHSDRTQLQTLQRSSEERLPAGAALALLRQSKSNMELSPISAPLGKSRELRVSPISFQHSRFSPFTRVPSRD